MTTELKHYVGDAEIGKQLGLTCRDCQSPNTVYAITKPLSTYVPAGAYCYRHLLERCIAASRHYGRVVIPFPIPETVLDMLKFDIKLALSNDIKSQYRGKGYV